MLLADEHAIVGRGLHGLLESAGHTVVAEASDRLEATNWMMEPPSPTTFLARNVGFVIADTNPEGHILAAQRGRVSVSCGTIGVAAVQ